MVRRTAFRAVIAAKVRLTAGAKAYIHLAASIRSPLRSDVGASVDAVVHAALIPADGARTAGAGPVVPTTGLAARLPSLPPPYAEGGVVQVAGGTAGATPRDTTAPQLLGRPASATAHRVLGPRTVGPRANPREPVTRPCVVVMGPP